LNAGTTIPLLVSQLPPFIPYTISLQNSRGVQVATRTSIPDVTPDATVTNFTSSTTRTSITISGYTESTSETFNVLLNNSVIGTVTGNQLNAGTTIPLVSQLPEFIPYTISLQNSRGVQVATRISLPDVTPDATVTNFRSSTTRTSITISGYTESTSETFNVLLNNSVIGTVTGNQLNAGTTIPILVSQLPPFILYTISLQNSRGFEVATRISLPDVTPDVNLIGQIYAMNKDKNGHSPTLDGSSAGLIGFIRFDSATQFTYNRTSLTRPIAANVTYTYTYVTSSRITFTLLGVTYTVDILPDLKLIDINSSTFFYNTQGLQLIGTEFTGNDGYQLTMVRNVAVLYDSNILININAISSDEMFFYSISGTIFSVWVGDRYGENYFLNSQFPYERTATGHKITLTNISETLKGMLYFDNGVYTAPLSTENPKIYLIGKTYNFASTYGTILFDTQFSLIYNVFSIGHPDAEDIYVFYTYISPTRITFTIEETTYILDIQSDFTLVDISGQKILFTTEHIHLYGKTFINSSNANEFFVDLEQTMLINSRVYFRMVQNGSVVTWCNLQNNVLRRYDSNLSKIDEYMYFKTMGKHILVRDSPFELFTSPI
jgi:hypothetical protein